MSTHWKTGGCLPQMWVCFCAAPHSLSALSMTAPHLALPCPQLGFIHEGRLVGWWGWLPLPALQSPYVSQAVSWGISDCVSHPRPLLSWCCSMSVRILLFLNLSLTFFCPVCCSLFSGRRGNLITVSAGLQTVQVSWLECCWGYCEFCGVAMALYTNWVALHHSEFNKLEFWNNPGIRFWKITHPYLLQLLWLLMAAGGHWQPVLPLCLHLASDLCTWVQFPSCNGSFFEFESTPTHVISS